MNAGSNIRESEAMKDGSSILVVDDDDAHRIMLRTLLSGWGYRVTEADDGQAAIDISRELPFDLILMDIRMVKVSGTEALEKIKAFNPAIPIIIMTAYSSVGSAVESMKKGAYDYLTKPLDFDELKLTMARAMEHRRLKSENLALKQTLDSRFDQGNIIGSSPAMVKLLETVSQVAPSEATVLITGESGVGKELIAGAIHFNSPRRNGPLVKMNCAAITETLLESELFGHEKGAFTGAHQRKEGRFKQADRGSLFLDEVSEMSLAMQSRLLRVLQEKEVTRVGGEEVIKVDVRVITATNKNLSQEVEEGRFRDDLYYRLNVIGVNVPALRERQEDIPVLAQHFLLRFAEKNQKKVKNFTPQAMDRLLKYPWPGNIRELMNVIERGVIFARSDYFEETELPPSLQPAAEPGEQSSLDQALPADLPLEQVEKGTIIKTLEAAGGNKSVAARRLGITRRTLYAKLKKYGVIS